MYSLNMSFSLCTRDGCFVTSNLDAALLYALCSTKQSDIVLKEQRGVIKLASLQGKLSTQRDVCSSLRPEIFDFVTTETVMLLTGTSYSFAM